jgi:hypothetical protein
VAKGKIPSGLFAALLALVCSLSYQRADATACFAGPSDTEYPCATGGVIPPTPIYVGQTVTFFAYLQFYAPATSGTVEWFTSEGPPFVETALTSDSISGFFTEPEQHANWQAIIYDNLGQMGLVCPCEGNASEIEFSVLAAVPEPSTWAIMLIGFAVIGFAGYRRSLRPAHQ